MPPSTTCHHPLHAGIHNMLPSTTFCHPPHAEIHHMLPFTTCSPSTACCHPPHADIHHRYMNAQYYSCGNDEDFLDCYCARWRQKHVLLIVKNWPALCVYVWHQDYFLPNHVTLTYHAHMYNILSLTSKTGRIVWCHSMLIKLNTGNICELNDYIQYLMKQVYTATGK